MTGLSKAKAERRLAELERVAISQGEWAWMHIEIQKRIREGRLKKWDTVGGAFTRDTFEDVPADGVILIGFRYTTVGGGNYPGLYSADLANGGDLRTALWHAGKRGEGRRDQGKAGLLPWAISLAAAAASMPSSRFT